MVLWRETKEDALLLMEMMEDVARHMKWKEGFSEESKRSH